MIHFVDAARDGELLAELKDEGVLTPDVMARIDQAMGAPESGTLNGFLLAGAAFIPEKPWLSWLIRRHGCHRFGRICWREDAREWAVVGLPADLNLPHRRCADGSILVAVMRPDLIPATARLQNERWHPAAATLAEIHALRTAWLECAGAGD